MPGFTAPKLLWVRKHEPEIFARIAKVLLPKDYLRYCLTGGFATDPSDAAGTLWLDVAQRDYSGALLAACGLSREQMPEVFEGNRVTGTLKPELAREWGLGEIPVIAGGGDNAAGAVGVGIVRPKQAMLSLGTSGVYFAVSDGFLANPASAVHSFCHALPQTWHLMSVMLNAAGCLDFTAQLTGYADVAALLADAQAQARDRRPWFLPYLTGERTPHNNVNAKGVFYGLVAADEPCGSGERHARRGGLCLARRHGRTARGGSRARRDFGDRRRLAQRLLDPDAGGSLRASADLARGR